MVTPGKEIPIIPQLLSCLTNHPDGANINEIAKGIGQGRDIVAKYLTVLNLMGRLELWTAGNTKVYRLAHRIPFHIFNIFPHGGVLGLNRAWVIKEAISPVCDLLSCSKDDLTGRHISEVIHPLFLDKKLIDMIRGVLDGREFGTGGYKTRIQECSFQIRIIPCIFDDGSIGIALIFQNLTQDQAARLEEQQLAERFQLFMKESGEFIAYLDRDDRIIMVNHALARYWRMSPSEFIGTTGLPSVFSDDLLAIKKSAGVISSQTDTPVPVPVEVRVILSDGTVHWQEWRAYSWCKEGIVQSIHYIGSDITDRKFKDTLLNQYKSGFSSIMQEKTEELREGTRMLLKEIKDRRTLEHNLKQSEERYRRLTETISDIIWETDEKNQISYISNRSMDIFGYVPGELVGRSFFDLIDNRGINAGAGDLAMCLASGKPFDRVQGTIRKNGGSSAVVEFSGIPISGTDGSNGGYYGIARDITKRIREEEKNSELLSIIEDTSDIVAVSRPDGSLRYVNPAGKAFFGVTKGDDIRQMNFFTFIPPEDHGEYKERRRIASDTGIWRGETVMLDAGRKPVSMSQIIHYHQVLAKEPYFSTIARDISERLEYEEELAQAYAYTRTLIEMSLDPLFTLGSDGIIRDVNNATELATGFGRNHLIRTDFRRYFSEPDIAQAGFELAISGELINEYPADILHRSGQITPVWLNASAYRDDSGTIQGVFITARKTGEPYPGSVFKNLDDIQGKPPPVRRKA